MTYKEALTEAMTELARDPATCFVGYGVRYGRAMGTLANVSEAQLIETPVAENLMVGLATGLALMGRRPVVFIERMDFLLNAADAVVNHLDKIAMMSRGEFKPAVIIRCVVGNRNKPLFTGETHVQNFTEAFAEMTRTIPVWSMGSAESVTLSYERAQKIAQTGQSSMLIEYKDLL